MQKQKVERVGVGVEEELVLSWGMPVCLKDLEETSESVLEVQLQKSDLVGRQRRRPKGIIHPCV